MKAVAALMLVLPLSICNPSEIPTGPLFCDVEEPRRFTQGEWDWRSANAPWNLRRDVKTNAAWAEECE